MKIIDLYIIKKFLGTFFFTLALIIAIAVVFDISEKIDDFLEKGLSFKTIMTDYYIYFIPYFANLFAPLFIFIAVIFFTSKMASQTEIIAILNSGVSFWRFLVPYFVAATILVIISLAVNNLIMPPANKHRIEFEHAYIYKQLSFSGRNIHKQIHPGNFVYFESYNSDRNIGYKFSIEQFKDGQLIYKLNADHVKWDSIGNFWVINNWMSREINGLNETLKSGERKDTVLNLYPKDFKRKVNLIETMDYFELNEFIEQEKMKGSDLIEVYLVEKYRRISMPFATFILTLMGVSLSSRKVRGGIGINIGIGVGLSFSYIMFMQIANTFATSGNVPVMLAVWTPNILYGILSLWLIARAPK
ncbi:MAG: Lipopolysaccharide export system permease protein LptG [Bacteroidia bacterium]|nr:Lipopolysaccharide export system permease protein LptG [Bacteroidia bacterium]